MSEKSTVSAKIKNLLELHTLRNPDLPVGTAYDDVIAFMRRVAHLPYSPQGHLTGITASAALQAWRMARVEAYTRDADITEFDEKSINHFMWYYQDDYNNPDSREFKLTPSNMNKTNVHGESENKGEGDESW